MRPDRAEPGFGKWPHVDKFKEVITVFTAGGFQQPARSRPADVRGVLLIRIRHRCSTWGLAVRLPGHAALDAIRTQKSV